MAKKEMIQSFIIYYFLFFQIEYLENLLNSNYVDVSASVVVVVVDVSVVESLPVVVVVDEEEEVSDSESSMNAIGSDETHPSKAPLGF
jgi:hypothetical protein